MKLLERTAELSAIEHALAEEGRLLLIEGPPGIGKTRLLAEARGLADAAGMRVMRARGGELEHEFAYGVVRQLFEPYLAAAGAEERAALLSGAAAPAGRLFGDAAGAPEGDAFPILHGLYWLTANVAAAQPLLLCVDDLHWCDVPTLRFLSFLARRLEGLPVVVVAATRPADVPGLDEARVLRPPALSEAATAALVRHELPGAEAEVCAACHEATGGNPLLVIELTRALEIEPVARNAHRVLEIGPEAVARAVRVRLERLPADAGALARAAAVLGDGALLADAGRLAELDERTAFAAAEALAGAGLLRPRETVEFVHPVERAAVYAGLGMLEQRDAHARAAELLAATHHPPEQVAAHIIAAPRRRDPAAVATLRAAARQALERGAADAAATYLQRALDEPPPPAEVAAVLLELGAAEQSVDGASAAGHLQAALDLVESSAERARTALALGQARYFSGELAASVEVLQGGLAEPDVEPDVASRLDGMLLVIAVYNAPWSGLARRRLDAYEPGPGDRVRLALSAYYEARAGGSRLVAVKRARRSVSPPPWIADIDSLAQVTASEVLLAADLPDEAEAAATAVVEAGHAAGSLFRVAVGSCFRAHVHLARGALAEAVADAWSAIEAAELHGQVPARLWSYGFLVQALLERGELDAAEEALARGELTAALPDASRVHGALLGRGRLKIARGRVRAGVDDLLELGRRYEGLGNGVNPAFLAWRSAAALGLHALGDGERAAVLAGEEVEFARAWGAPRALARALRTRGLLAGDLELLQEALADGSPGLLERAHCQVDLGAALRRANRRAEARERLRDGLDLAHRCGAQPLRERALAELVSAGARPRRPSLSGRDSLTPSELRVADLATGGQTNREIAQRLFVTQKTVETHLRNVFRKLGLESRAQLARALEEEVAA